MPPMGGGHERFNSIEASMPSLEQYSPYEKPEKQRQIEEKMLIEQDPFLLEEQRYLNRM